MPTPPALTEELLEWRQRHEVRHGRLASVFAQGTPALFRGATTRHTGKIEITCVNIWNKKKERQAEEARNGARWLSGWFRQLAVCLAILPTRTTRCSASQRRYNMHNCTPTIGDRWRETILTMIRGSPKGRPTWSGICRHTTVYVCSQNI
jgi:alcohol dehydrogenase YqhD (iron-dependent ADH family)